MEQIVRTFNLGRSTVVTLPKSFGVKPGVRMKARRKGKEVVLVPTKEEDMAKLVKKLAGGLNLRDVTPEQLNKELDNRYEEMLPRR